MDVPVDRLTRLANEIVRHAGGSDDEAEIVSRHLVDANLAGHDSHGVGMLPAYTGGIAEGRLKPGAHAEVVLDKGAYVLIDGNRGFGQVVAREAMQITIAKAKEMGVAVSGLRNSYHIGRVGAWGEMCADAGFISIHYVNALSPNSLVAPFGGTEARFTTNPYCTAIPESDRHPRLSAGSADQRVSGDALPLGPAFEPGDPVVAVPQLSRLKARVAALAEQAGQGVELAQPLVALVDNADAVQRLKALLYLHGLQSGQQRRERGLADARRHVAGREDSPLLSETGDVGGLHQHRAHEPKVCETLIVGDDVDDVRLLAGITAARHEREPDREQPGQARDSEAHRAKVAPSWSFPAKRD